VISNGAEEILRITDNNINEDKLKLFAHVGDGDMIGYWVKSNSLDESPIVYVSHDGESGLIASNIREFFQTLVSAQARTVDEWDALTKDEWDEIHAFSFEIQFSWCAFDKREFKNAKRWVKRNLDITAIEDRHEHARAAKKKFGNFEKWMEKYGNN